MRSMQTWHVSRRDRFCQAQRSRYDVVSPCRGVIRDGERYCRSALPPNSEMGNSGWWTNNLCQSCATYYGYQPPVMGATHA